MGSSEGRNDRDTDEGEVRSVETIQTVLDEIAGARVLVIDDERIIIDAIATILECEVIGAATAEEGLAKFADLPSLDLVFVDKNLPDGSGLDVVRRLKEMCPDQEIILITGYPSLDSAIETVEAGAFDYMPKPFESSTMLFKARNAIAKTKLTRKEQLLAEQVAAGEVRYRALFEASPDAILVFDEETQTVAQANAAALRMYGYSAEKLVGVSRSELMRQESNDTERLGACSAKQGALKTDANSLGTSFLEGTRYQARRRDGSEFSVEVSRGVASLDGRAAFVEVIRDVSERLRIEQERLDVAKRLRKSERMESLGQLAAGIAHDFNNLLVVFMGAVAEIGDWVDSHPGLASEDLCYAKDDLEQVTKSAHKLTRQLLGFGSRQVPHRELLDVKRVTLGIFQFLRRTLTERISIELDVGEDLPRILMDQGHFEQIITNLALNARDAMPSGGVLRVTAQARSTTRGIDEVGIRVTDTGLGMDTATRERVFEPFFTTKEPDRGTGLGLATVHGIVRSNHGSISVMSTPGEGTTFELVFPGNNGEEVTPQDEAETVMGAHVGERILVVEDHEHVRLFVERALARAGFDVSSACDSDVALAMVKASPAFDLLLTDLGLPSMQGDELAGLLLREHGMKVLCMSAYVPKEESDGRRAFPFLAKPFTGNRLLARVRETLDEAG